MDVEVVINNNEPTGTVRHRCSGMKRNRTPCANRVRQSGAFCYLHADQDRRTSIDLSGYIQPDASRRVVLQDTMEDVLRSVTDEEQQTLSLNQIFRAHLDEDLAEEVLTYNAYNANMDNLRSRAAGFVRPRRDYHAEIRGIRALRNENIVNTSGTLLAGEHDIGTSGTRAQVAEVGTPGTPVAERHEAGTQVAEEPENRQGRARPYVSVGPGEAGTSGTQVAEVNEAGIPGTRAEAPLPVQSRRGSVRSSNPCMTRSDTMSYMRQMAEESSLPLLIKITEMQDDIGKITDALKKANISIEDCSNNEKYRCCVCYSLEKSNMFVPCNHLACCAPCAEIIMRQSGKCPVCNNSAIEHTRVYI